jgi:hypothetical protein
VAALAAVLGLSSRVTLSIGYPTRELLSVASIVATPLAQWLALRASGLRWGREWAVAAIAGAMIVSAALSILQSSWIGVRFGPQSSLVFSLASAAAVAVLQWAVLRRRAGRAAMWLVIAAAVWMLERGLQWAATGAVVAGPSTSPISVTTRLSIAGAAACVEGLALGWIVWRPSGHTAASDPPPSRAWSWLEWTSMGALSLLTIMGTSGLIETWFRNRSGVGAAFVRPLFAAFAGLVLGAVQWALLRRRLALSPVWIAMSAAALSIPALGIFIPVLGALVFYGWLMALQIPGGMVLAGTWFGICQWLVLRRYARRSYVWIPATALAWGAYHLTAFPISLSLRTVGLLAGAISGLALFALVPTRRAPA